jgi:hypothetical protein
LLLNAIGALVAPMALGRHGCFARMCLVCLFRLAKAPAKLDRTLRWYREIRPFLSHNLLHKI